MQTRVYLKIKNIQNQICPTLLNMIEVDCAGYCKHSIHLPHQLSFSHELGIFVTVGK